MIIVGAVFKFVPRIFVSTNVLEVVKALKNWMLLKHPVIGLAHKRFEDGSGNSAVIVSAQCDEMDAPNRRRNAPN